MYKLRSNCFHYRSYDLVNNTRASIVSGEFLRLTYVNIARDRVNKDIAQIGRNINLNVNDQLTAFIRDTREQFYRITDEQAINTFFIDPLAENDKTGNSLNLSTYYDLNLINFSPVSALIREHYSR